MQTRRTSPDHHHQERVLASNPPEAELIALARSKGQMLAERTLASIRDTLELHRVTLAEFVADVRPHFRNNILNPSGFLIDRARHFSALSRPAVIRATPGPIPEPKIPPCGACKGQKLVMVDNSIAPCPECATAEFRKVWEIKEAERARRGQTRS